MTKHIAIYIRVSTKRQDQRSQIADLERWAKAYGDGAEIRWYKDKASGKSMDRDGWSKLAADLEAGRVSKIVVWRIDRLGRTARGLTALFHDLGERGVNLVSIKDSLDLNTAAGRPANVLASVAQFETELRSERQRAGIDAARASGKRWGGRSEGSLNVKTATKAATVKKLHKAGSSISEIARICGMSRTTVYKLLG